MKETIYDSEYLGIVYDNNIIHVTFKKGPITLDIVKVLVDKRLEFSKGIKFPVLVSDEGSGVSSLERDAREFIGAGRATEGISASAFYTDSTFNKYIINFFLRISTKQTNFPTKIFSEKDEAIKWLQNFIEKK